MATDGRGGWLKALTIIEGFHRPCNKCATFKKNTRDVSVHFFDLETHKGLCGTCSTEAHVKGHRLLQVSSSFNFMHCKFITLSYVRNVRSRARSAASPAWAMWLASFFARCNRSHLCILSLITHD
jgi:hypothetical protein